MSISRCDKCGMFVDGHNPCQCVIRSRSRSAIEQQNIQALIAGAVKEQMSRSQKVCEVAYMEDAE
jgi:hypothetical protein